MCVIMTRSGAESWWGKELPKEVAYLIKEDGECRWKEVSYKEIIARKKAKQDGDIRLKRAHEEIRPCAVWVFCNEHGINDMFFKGWWIYIRTLRGDYALNYRHPRQDLITQVKQLFPCGLLPFDDVYDKAWFEAFEKRYHYPGVRKRNAVAFCHCKISSSGYLLEIKK